MSETGARARLTEPPHWPEGARSYRFAAEDADMAYEGRQLDDEEGCRCVVLSTSTSYERGRLSEIVVACPVASLVFGRSK